MNAKDNPEVMTSETYNSMLDNFDHVVVLMLENRSFDNLLGYLYSPLDPVIQTVFRPMHH